MEDAFLREVWDALLWGEVQDARKIADTVGVPRGRTVEKVRAACRELCRQGFPVVGNHSGFQKTVSTLKLAACSKMLNGKAMANMERASGLMDRINSGWQAAAYEEQADEFFGSTKEDKAAS